MTEVEALDKFVAEVAGLTPAQRRKVLDRLASMIARGERASIPGSPKVYMSLDSMGVALCQISGNS